MTDSGVKAKAFLKASLKAKHELGIGGASNDAYETARNILHEELGIFGERPDRYNLDEHTRDTLIAHGRQDAAHALLNTVALLRVVNRLLLLTVLMFTALIGVFVSLIWP